MAELKELQYTFLSMVRRGMATSISESNEQTHVEVDVKLKLSGKSEMNVPVILYGPGEVVSVNPQIVLHTYPPANTYDVESNYFPLIEFYEADFPWRYTPMATNGDDLQPWLTLIALNDDEIEQQTTVDKKGTLPSITTNITNLPDLNEAKYWAHVQLMEAEPNPEEKVTAQHIKMVLKNHPEQIVSRILCPRIMDPKISYTIFLVPTFKRGRRAGLNESLDESVKGSLLSWPNSTDDDYDDTASITLPIYYQWRIQTGVLGDFEYLARQLQPQTLNGDEIGTRPVRIDIEGNDIFNLEGALTANPTGSKINGDFVETLKNILNSPNQIKSPLYGRWHANKQTFNEENAHWFNELNGNRCWRIVASLGTKVVQEQQQHLMASAWEQVEGIREINRLLLRSELSLVASSRFYDRLKDDVPLLASITSPLHSQIKVNDWTIREQLRRSRALDTIFEPQFRRMTRRFGPIALRSGAEITAVPELGLFETMLQPDYSLESSLTVKPEDSVIPDEVFSLGVYQAQLQANDSTLHNELVNGLRSIIAHSETWTAICNMPSMSIWGAQIVEMNEAQVIEFLPKQLDRNKNNGLSALNAALSEWKDNPHNLATLSARLPNSSNQLKVFLFQETGLTSEGQAISDAIGKTAVWQSISKRQDLLSNISREVLDIGAINTPENALLVLHDKTDRRRTNLVDKLLSTLIQEEGKITDPATSSLDILEIEVQVVKDTTETSFNHASEQLQTVFGSETSQPADEENEISSDQLFGENGIQARINPHKTILHALNARLPSDLEINLDERNQEIPAPIPPIMAAPQFDQPMYREVKKLGQEWLLPGVGKIPANSVSLLYTNPKFVESFMVGLNHEMARELRWQEYPTDQRGTYFRYFWNTDEMLEDAADEVDKREAGPIGIGEIAKWEGELGQNISDDSQTVLLIRGELFHRYPNTLVYAVAAEKKTKEIKTKKDDVEETRVVEEYILKKDDESATIWPIFQGHIEPDIVFFGFDLSSAAAKDDPGYFFVLEEPSTQLRFGFDEEKRDEQNGHKYYRPKTTPEDKREDSVTGFAEHRLQRPFRVAFHAKDILPD